MTTQLMQNGQTSLAEKRRELASPPRHIGQINPLSATPDPRALEDVLAAIRRPERVTLDTLDASHPKVAYAVSMARTWAQRKRASYLDASLVLCGPNGVGKTHIARAIWWSMTTRATRPEWDEESQTFVEQPLPGTEQPSGLFKLSNDWITALGQTRDADTGLITTARASALVGTSPLVVIDDVGAEQAIPFIAGEQQAIEKEVRFFKLVDYCYTAQISLVVTSNKPLAELATHLGRRAWDRLTQMAPRLPNGDSFMVEMFDVPSYRVATSGR
jgi:DNA replication protein DnaC